MIKGLILAFQFLTRLPINIAIDFNDKNIRNSIFFFPLVGAVIGAIGGFVYYILSPLNIEIASFLTMLTLIILTGGIHIDGLSDTFDGFLSNRDREKVLEIMKDSRIGAFGVLSIVILLLFKYILIKNTPNLPIGLILSLANSRLVVGYIISYKKCARPGGLGDLFNKSNPKKLIILSSLLYVFILLVFNKAYIIPLLATILTGEIISYIAYKKIGGLTGDVYGTIIEIGECISLLTYLGMIIWI
jgi:adenosylcobinamide-GDP ribazoletransferase